MPSGFNWLTVIVQRYESVPVLNASSPSTLTMVFNQLSKDLRMFWLSSLMNVAVQSAYVLSPGILIRLPLHGTSITPNVNAGIAPDLHRIGILSRSTPVIVSSTSFSELSQSLTFSSAGESLAVNYVIFSKLTLSCYKKFYSSSSCCWFLKLLLLLCLFWAGNIILGAISCD